MPVNNVAVSRHNKRYIRIQLLFKDIILDVLHTLTIYLLLTWTETCGATSSPVGLDSILFFCKFGETGDIFRARELRHKTAWNTKVPFADVRIHTEILGVFLFSFAPNLYSVPPKFR